MSEQRKPAGVKAPASSNSSRALAIGAVGLLIVVAIAGIVLAGRHPASDNAASAVASGTMQPASAAPTAVNPNEVIFDAGSAKLPVTAADSIARFAESGRTGDSTVRISARFLTGANKARDHDLAAARTSAVREALQADGIGAGRLRVELIEMPAGTLPEADANRIELALH